MYRRKLLLVSSCLSLYLCSMKFVEVVGFYMKCLIGTDRFLIGSRYIL